MHTRLVMTLWLMPFAALAAQTPDSAAAAAPAPAPAPAAVSRKPPVGPGGAFLRSFILPGWGQVALHRPVTALVFVGVEGTLVGLSLKAIHDVKVARQTDTSPDSAVVTARKRTREDWLVLLGFNHLLAGLEAYVASHLWDFPGDLRVRALPGGIGASATIPIRFR